MARSLLVVLLLIVGLGACSDSESSADKNVLVGEGSNSDLQHSGDDGSVDVANLGTAAPGDGSDPRRGPTTLVPGVGSDAGDAGESDGSTTTAVVQSITSTTGVAVDVDAQGHRIAPVGSMPAELLLWESGSSARKAGHDGVWAVAVSGTLSEVADVPGLGVVYQRPESTSTIWLASATGERELIVGSSGETLRLEGAGVSAAGETLIYYQKFQEGDIETAISTLRSYNVDTKDVTEIMVTGGWESGTQFSFLSGGETIAVMNAEGWSTFGDVDLEGETPVEAAWSQACYDGEEGCVEYIRTAMVNGEGIGLSYIWGDGVIDKVGLYSFGPGAAERSLLGSFDWDNGLWYPEDMFALGVNIVISLADGEGDALPALVFDLNTGEYWTLPEAAFVRPAYLS